MYKDIAHFMETCVTCQMYSNVRHHDGLHPTYPPAMHYKWIVDLVTMPLRIWQMLKSSVASSTRLSFLHSLATEDLTNQVEELALKTKSTEAV